MTHLGWLLRNSLVALLGVAIAFGVLRIWLGPIPIMGARLRGDVIVLDRAEANLGTLRANEERDVAFGVTNIAATPMKILGVRTSCSCTSTTRDFPVVIAPEATLPLGFSFHAPEDQGRFVQRIEIEALSGGKPVRITCRISGTVAATPPRNAPSTALGVQPAFALSPCR